MKKIILITIVCFLLVGCNQLSGENNERNEKRLNSEAETVQTPMASPTLKPVSFSDFLDEKFEKYNFIKKDTNGLGKCIVISDAPFNKKYRFGEYVISPVINYDDNNSVFGFLFYRYSDDMLSADVDQLKMIGNKSVVINNSFVQNNGVEAEVTLYNTTKSNKYNRNYKKIRELFMNSNKIVIISKHNKFVMHKEVIKEYRAMFDIYDGMITTYKDNTKE